jgi:hypothetical protein
LTVRFYWYIPVISWNRILPEKLTLSQLAKKFPAFYGAQRFIQLSQYLCTECIKCAGYGIKLGHFLLLSGRGKKGNRLGLLMLGGLFKSGLLALGLKGLAILAGKALLVAKIALVLSSIIGLSKLFGSGQSEGKTTYEIVKHPHISHAHTHSSSYGHFDSDGHDYKRSIQTEDPAVYPHLLAYAGQRQGQKA